MKTKSFALLFGALAAALALVPSPAQAGGHRDHGGYSHQRSYHHHHGGSYNNSYRGSSWGNCYRPVIIRPVCQPRVIQHSHGSGFFFATPGFRVGFGGGNGCR